jgi:hypothetical protein
VVVAARLSDEPMTSMLARPVRSSLLRMFTRDHRSLVTQTHR